MGRGRLHHVSLQISDPTRSRYFYDRFLLPIGFRRFTESEEYLGYTDGDVTVWFVRDHRPRIHRKPPEGDEEVIAEHLAFRVGSEGEVRAREAELNRAEIYPIFRAEEHPEFRPGYFSATWIDPDGIAIELYTVPSGRARKRSGGRRPAARARKAATRPKRRARRARAAR